MRIIIKRRWHCLIGVAVVLGCQTATWAQVLSGTVVDSETGEAVPGALVELAPSNRGSGYMRAELGEDAVFRFEGVRKDSGYNITVTAEGFCPYEEHWSMPALQQDAAVQLSLVRAAALTGHLSVASTGEPLPGVEVSVWQQHRWRRRHHPKQTFTAPDGRFHFEGLVPGTYDFEAAVPGYITEHYEGIHLQTGGSRELDVKMVAPARIIGRITVAPAALIDAPSGEWPVHQATVTSEGPSQTKATTDADGYFVLQDLRPGKYRLQLDKKGFHKQLVPQVFEVAEGDSIEGLELVLDPESRAIHLISKRDVFRPGEAPEIQVRSFRIPQVDFSLTKVPPEEAFTGDLALLTFEDTSILLPGEEVLTWQMPTEISGREFTWIDRKVEIPEELEPGTYVLSAKAAGLESRKAFFVSSLGLIVKRGEHRLLVYACDLDTSEPVSGVEIVGRPLWTEEDRKASSERISSFAGDLTRMGSTDENGILDTVVSHDRIGLIGAHDGIHFAASNLHFGTNPERERVRVLGFTDRPIYRPGHTLQFKAIVRREEPDGLTPIVGKTLNYRVRKPRGEEMMKGSLPLSDFGTAHGKISLPVDAPLGTYRVELYSAHWGGTFTFDVQEYRKPPFKVEIESDRADYLNGDRIVFTIRGRYYFGFPVRGGIVRYNVYETRLSDDDYWCNAQWGGYSTVFHSGKVLLDAEGNATIQLDAGYKFYNRRLTLEATVEDPSRREAESQISVRVGKGAYLIHLNPAQRFYDAGNPVEVEITTRSLSGSPVSAEVTVTLEQETWSALYARYEVASRPIGSITLQTEEDGKGKAVFATENMYRQGRWGRLRVAARSKDHRANLITVTRYLWVLAGSGGTCSYQYKTLELSTDREEYELGETAVALINTPQENHPMLLTVEAEDILEYRFMRSQGKTTRIEIPIRKDFSPNCFITVSYQDGIHFHSRTAKIRVKTERPKMSLETEIEGYRKKRDRVPEFRPGDQVTVHLRTRDEHGNPTAAEIALAVVDEAIFAIRADQTPDPEDFFYHARSNWVRTAYSFPMRHYGGAGKSRKQLEVRRNFKDTAFWDPSIRTGPEGEATVHFQLPDNLTSWRLTSRGGDQGPRFCVRRDTLIASKDVLTVLEGPRFFHRGDRVTIPALIHNRLDEAAAGVQASLEAGKGVSVESPDRRVDIGPLSSHRESWAVRIGDDAQQALLTVSALADADSDAMEVTIPVTPRGRPLRIFSSGIISSHEDHGGITLTLPPRTSMRDLEVNLYLHASVIATTFQSINYLRYFPFGCLEQTMNGFLPRCVLARAIEDMLPEQADAEGGTASSVVGSLFHPREVYLAAQEGITRVLQRQNEDGGWSWWAAEYADPMVTAFVLEGLLLMRGAGFRVPQDHLDRGLKCLNEMATGSQNPNLQAYGLHVLSLAGMKKDPIARALIRRATEGDLTTDGLAYGALYYHRNGDSATADLYLGLMFDSVVDADSALLWRQATNVERPPWFGGWEEMTARCLMALAACRPDHPACGRLVSGLLRARRGSRWSSTRSTSLIVLAFAQYLRARPENLLPQGPIHVLCNDEPVGTREIPLSRGIPTEASISIPAQFLRTGENQLSFQKQSAFTLYISLEGQGWVTGDIPPVSAEEVEVRRELFLAERVVDSRGRAQILEKELGDSGKIPAGHEIGCRTILTAKRKIPFPLLQVFLPSGFEVTEIDFGTGWWKPYEYSERRDRSIDFAFKELPEGETRITSLLRAELAGDFYAPPATLWAMYDPQIEAWTSPGILRVRDGKE